MRFAYYKDGVQTNVQNNNVFFYFAFKIKIALVPNR